MQMDMTKTPSLMMMDLNSFMKKPKLGAKERQLKLMGEAVLGKML